MWPIEFIKRLLLYVLRGLVAMFEGARALRSLGSSGGFSAWKSPDSTDDRRPKPIDDIPDANKISELGREVRHVRRGLSLRIGLQPSARSTHARTIIQENISPNMTAKDLIEILSTRFRVNKDKWELLVFSNEKAPYVLEKDAKLARFFTSKKERLYFYPEILVR